MDRLKPELRSENMRRIRSKDTVPELIVRSLTHRMGYRYRLHVRNLPGKPDLVFRPRKKVIFVHGCFWHQHADCKEGRIPASKATYWKPKLLRNVKRDRSHLLELVSSGWKVLVIWECQIRDTDRLEKRLRKFLV